MESKYYELDPDEGSVLLSISDWNEDQKQDILNILNMNIHIYDYIEEDGKPYIDDDNNKFLYCLDVNVYDLEQKNHWKDLNLLLEYLKKEGYKNNNKFLEW